MKKIISVLLFTLLILSFNICSFAAEPVSVRADDVTLVQNQEISVPVKIENNSGIMGFKITVEYPVDKIDIKSVSRGDITSKGNFNTNFGINDGRFDVLWNNVEESGDNGSLFIITVEPVSTSDFNTEIKLSYSQPDTFNEKYEDVIFDCRNIAFSFSVNENQNDSETTTTQITSEKQDSLAYDNNHILTAVKESLAEYGYASLSEINSDNQQYFLDTVNQKLSELSNGKYAAIDSFENLISLYNSAYEGVFITDITNEISSENIQQAIKAALKTVGANSISDLKDEFVKELEKNLKNYNSNVPSISEDIDVDKALDIAQKLDDATKPVQAQQDSEENDNANNTWIIVLVSVLCIVVIVTAGIIIIKKRKKNAKSK